MWGRVVSDRLFTANRLHGSNVLVRITRTFVSPFSFKSNRHFSAIAYKNPNSCDFYMKNNLFHSVETKLLLSRNCAINFLSKGMKTSGAEEQLENPYSEDIISKDDKEANAPFEDLIKGNRSSLARSITMAESTNPTKRARAQLLLSKVLDHNKKSGKHSLHGASSFRIGLSGPPGAGKSTFIEAFGKYLTGLGHKVAVLAVDPSSTTTGGSLLGDKTRMPELSCDMNAYIRPSPSSGTLGGVTRCTNDAIVLCEGAGYKYILVETVGVGQSEFAVADMVDIFCLIIPPAGGDELQGIKKGIVEVADVVIVNKADGDLQAAAKRIQTEYVSALKFVRARSKVWKPKVVRISSLTKEGIPELWEKITEFKEKVTESGEYAHKREKQHKVWMWNHIKDNIMGLFKEHPSVKAKISKVETMVAKGAITSGYAADILLKEFSKSK